MADQGAFTRLSGHAVLDTTDPDEAREVIGRIFCPHFLSPAARRPHGFRARHNSAPGPGFSVNMVAYGAEVEIDPGELSGFFLLQVPLSGSARVRCGTAVADAVPGRMASLLSPTLPTRMVWSDGCEKMIVLLSRHLVEQQAAALAGRPLGPVEFLTGVPLDDETGRLLMGQVGLMEMSADCGAGPSDPWAVSLRDSLTTFLLMRLASSVSDAFRAPVGEPAPAAVRLAEAYVEAHAEQPITMAEIAAAAGVGLRSLQLAIRKSRGTTLTDLVLTMRLQKFRERLLDRNEPRSVADLALAAGLGHLGRAAQAYRARYGETPSQTLRRSR